ncbi:MAG: hypothetical protein V4559_15465 [Pseudomonadota bacterium]
MTDIVKQMHDDGVLFAQAGEGYELPIIDLAHPRFFVPDEPGPVGAMRDAFHADDIRRRRIPKFLMRFVLRSAARKSRLVHALFGSGGGFLDGLSTYVMKLGAENLVPPYDDPIDRKFAASPHIPLLRLRMQQVATMVADGVKDELLRRPQAPLHLINIGGGPAIDSINTLMRLNAYGCLQRPVVIHVLDGDDAGPAFGAKALAVLKAEGNPLQGTDVTFDHQRYDWNRTSLLEELMGSLKSEYAVVAASSEGALFEYGTDQAIIGNLKALRTGAALVAGSVTSADAMRRRMIADSKFKIFPRGIEGFAPLAAAAGFAIAQSRDAMLSDQVLLRPV